VLFSSRLFAVLTASFVLLLLGTTLRFGILALAGIAVLSLPLFSFSGFYIRIRSFRSLAFERRLLRSRVIRGGLVEVRVELMNPSGIPLKVNVRDSFTSRLKLVLGSNRRELTINPRENVSFNYFLKAEEEGVAQIGPAIVSMSDGLGFFRVTRKFEKLNRIVVLPPIREVRESVIEYGGPHEFISLGEHASKSVGISTEYASSREYVPGDDLRFVDWKATARTGKLIVKEFESQTSSSYLIIVDCGRSMSKGEIRKIDYLKQAVIILAREAVRKGDEIGLLIPSVSGIAFPSGIRRYLPPAAGIEQLYSIMELISFIQASGTPNFLKSIEFIERKRRPPLNIFLITDLEDFREKKVYEAVRRAMSAGYNVVIISPYTPLFLEPRKILGEGGAFEVLVGMDIVEEDRRTRTEIIGKLRGLGAKVIEVGPGDFFPVILAEYHLASVKPR